MTDGSNGEANTNDEDILDQETGTGTQLKTDSG
jgi:hypothetical protein